jgi:putative nucleotidyltransferase with HDIG domain
MVGTRMSWPVRVDDARSLAEHLLEDLPERWHHTIGVAKRAEELTGAIGTDDPETLLAAAWLHDIGYARPLHDTGFHPLDGARYLERSGWPTRLAALVAHHSGAGYLAVVHGLSGALARYPREHTALADALTYADQTVGPYGHRMTVQERMREMIERHGSGSAQARVHHLRGPYLLDVAGRVRRRLEGT